MKTTISVLLIAIFFSACSFQPQPEKKQKYPISSLNNVSYSLDKDGNLKLEKEYIQKDTKTNKIKKTVISEDLTPSVKPYEKVPLFDKGYKKQLSLKGQKRKSFSVKGGKVKVSVESIPLNEFVDLVFGSVLKLNYTTDENVKKMKNPITLNMTESQKTSEFFKVVKKILSLNGVKVQEDSGILFIHKTSKKNSITTMEDIYIGYGRSLPANLEDDREVMLFVPYYYITPGNTVNILRQAGMSNVKFYYYINGIQTMRAKAGDIRKALKLINLLDRPYLKGKTPYLVSFNDIDVSKFLPKMKQIFHLNSVNITTVPSKGGIVLLPIEDLNALYVITPKKEWLDMLLYWKTKLDIPSKTEEEPRLYIYHVKNRKADELAKAVSGVLGITKTTKKTQPSKTKTTKKPKKSKTKKSKKTTKKDSSTLFVSQANYKPTVKADLDTNILMMKLTPKHYKMLLPFIEELDKLPLQTLVEVTVAEVDMTDTFSLGFEYAIRSKNLGISDILTVSGGGSGLGIVFNSDKIDATINSYAEKKLLDIVSRPKILILNNKTGSINVGTQVPIITSETSASDIETATPTINRNISYRTTGIILGLTPTINSNGVLTMKISINLSEAQLNDTSGIDSPLIVNRQLSTVAVVHSGDTILLGGLISKNKSDTRSGIPYLKDIPLIGDAFASDSYKNTKTELIMLIRPVIIETPQKIKDETDKFKTLLEYIDIDEL